MNGPSISKIAALGDQTDEPTDSRKEITVNGQTPEKSLQHHSQVSSTIAKDASLVVEPVKQNRVQPYSTDYDNSYDNIGGSKPTGPKTGSTDINAMFSKNKVRRFSLTVESVTEALQKFKAEERFLVRPDNPNLQYWDLSIFVALLFTAVVTPFEVAFIETHFNALFMINRMVDLLFICDMVLQFMMMYHHENGRLIKSHRMIRKRYMRGWFTIDFLTVLPFDSAKYVIKSDVSFVRIIRLLRLFKLLRIVRASRIFTRWETKLGIDHGSMTYIKLSFTLSAMTHWFACFWGLTTFLQSESTATWLTVWLDSRVGTPPECTTNGAVGAELIANGGFREGCFEIPKIYLACFQLAVMTITGAGPGGGVEPCNTAENMAISFLTLLSGVAWANIIGQICGLAAAGDPVQHIFHQTNDDINRLMRDTNIQPHMRQHVRLYLRHSKNAMRERARKDILKNLSPELSGQMAIMGQRWIKERMCFWVKTCSPAFLALLITRMSCLAYAPKEIIAANECMYILKKGTCMTTRLMMKSSINTCWNIDFVLTHPAYRKIRQMVAGRTLTFVQVDVLSLETFEDLMSCGFPETDVIIRKIRWWAVLRTIQYKYEQHKKRIIALASQEAKETLAKPAPRPVLKTPHSPSSPKRYLSGGSSTGSPRLSMNSHSHEATQHQRADIRMLTASHARLAQQIEALTKIVKDHHKQETIVIIEQAADEKANTVKTQLTYEC